MYGHLWVYELEFNVTHIWLTLSCQKLKMPLFSVTVRGFIVIISHHYINVNKHHYFAHCQHADMCIGHIYTLQSLLIVTSKTYRK